MPPHAAGRRRPVSWDKDGVDGGPSSVDVTLTWFTAEGNLQRWRGDTVGGKTKKALASEIVEKIKKAGITGRSDQGVLQKVHDIQDSYNKAADLKRQSGEGVLDADEEKTFHDKLVSICKLWDLLDPVFHDRASAKPIAPTGTFNPPVSYNFSAPRGDGQINELQADFDFPYGVCEYPKSSDSDDEDGVRHGDIDEPADYATAPPALVSTDMGAQTSSGNATREPVGGAPSITTRGKKGNGKQPANPKRGKSLTLSTKPQKKRKSLDDVMYDSICERTKLAEKRSRIELAQAKIQYTRYLLELGIYTADEVKAMVVEHFEEK